MDNSEGHDSFEHFVKLLIYLILMINYNFRDYNKLNGKFNPYFFVFKFIMILDVFKTHFHVINMLNFLYYLLYNNLVIRNAIKMEETNRVAK